MELLLDILWGMWILGWTVAGILVLCYVIAYVNDEITKH